MHPRSPGLYILALAANLTLWGGEAARTPSTHRPASASEASHTALFLAGVPALDGSPFHPWQQDLAWARHVRDSNLAWAKAERDRLPAMRRFQNNELRGEEFRDTAIFYPFGGPDVLTVTTLFPSSPAYILVGLEPPGSLPRPEILRRRPLAEQLSGYRRLLDSVLHRTFFITAEMDRQMRGQLADGMLPAMIMQLVRTGCRLLEVRPLTLDAEGRPSDAAAVPDGVAVTFARTGRPQTAYYFRANLATGPLENNPAFLRFLARFPKLATFFKATSYMPHYTNFARLRAEVLARSRVVVQDDSGIPYRHFDPRLWQVRLYGAYEQPYGSFRKLRQADLWAAYRSQRAVPKLEFGIGYGYGRVPSNLQIAVRRPSPLAPG